MRICKTCEKEYDGFLISHSAKYCSEKCRKVARAKVNFAMKNKRIERLESGDIDFIANEVFKNYKSKAPGRGLEFSLTVEFFKKNVKAPCYYCNQPVNRVGFDRLDNSIGYTEANSVPCCTDCNFMKRNMSYNDFIDKCHRISKNLTA